MNQTPPKAITSTRLSLSEEVSQYLVSNILGGKFAPGSFLPTEQEFCETLQVSRTAVREALKIVSAKGLLVAIPGRGTMVNPSPLQALSAPIEFAMHCEGTSYRELLEMRLLLEREAASLAAERISADELSRLREYLQVFRTSGDRAPNENWEEDPEVMFHKTMVDASHHSVLRVLYLPLLIIWTRSLREISVNWTQYQPDDQRKQQTLKRHEQILQALEQHDPTEAAEAVEAHLQEAQRHLQLQISLGAKLQ
jgi:GntR family transcriptional regulator, transcriptional repressor for pyruvate dehydrogenase complex